MLDKPKKPEQMSRLELTGTWIVMTIGIAIFTVIMALPTYFFICLIKYDLTPLYGNWFLSQFLSNYKIVIVNCLWGIGGIYSAIQILTLISPVRAERLGDMAAGILSNLPAPINNDPTGRKTWVRGHFRRIK